MIPVSPPILDLIIVRLQSRAALDAADCAAVRGLHWHFYTAEPSTWLTREGQRPERFCLLASGTAYRQKITADGSRQILAFHIAGDLIGIDGILLDVADHNIQALTRCELACVSRSEMRRLVAAHPCIATALWTEGLVESARLGEWVANVGRRDARTRIAHLFCELYCRLEAAGLAADGVFELPATQEQIGDAAGLTPVHVNRVLQALERDGLVRRTRRHVELPRWEALRQAAGFNATYLHLDHAQLPCAAARAA